MNSTVGDDMLPEAREHVARCRGRVAIEPECAFDRVQHARAARMDGETTDVCEPQAVGLQPSVDEARELVLDDLRDAR
jgi:hypothetical protein